MWSSSGEGMLMRSKEKEGRDGKRRGSKLRDGKDDESRGYAAKEGRLSNENRVN